MKTIRNIMTLMLIALMGMSVKAQVQQNRLIVPDQDVQYGKAQLPVVIENTDELVAAQFDLTLPEGVTADAAGQLTNRGDDHLVSVRSMGAQVYRVMLFSPTNATLLGQSGTAFYLSLNIPESIPEGSVLDLAIEKAVLSKASGENVLSEATAGSLRVAKLPDLLPGNITCDLSQPMPGSVVNVSWQVSNIGELSTAGGWTEQVSLVSEDDGLAKLIATTHYDEPLAAKAMVGRTVTVALPSLLGLDGEARVQVRIVPDADCGEKPSAQGNNTQAGADLLTIGKALSFELSPIRVEEKAGTRITAKVSRSGRWTEAQSFTLSATADSRLDIPATVEIPAGQSGLVFYLKAKNNDVLDSDSIVDIAIEGNGYAKQQQRLTIIDDEYPDLTLTASKSVVAEGETFQLTVTTGRVSAWPIEVTLSSENTKRFSYPQTATIPAGETTVTFDVTALDDDLPAITLSNAFTASASRHNKGEAVVMLQDNDLPVLQLTLTPATVSESAGVVAVSGLLRRTTHTDGRITVKLTDDAEGGLYFGNRTLELTQGVEEAHFSFGPVDNSLVDGDRTYTVTAAVWLSSCNCGATGELAGYTTAQLQVLDNDGPALGLTSSVATLKEGDKATLTITRNTDNSVPLTVTLKSDYTEGLTYQQNVTIPAGQQSTTVEVSSAANDEQGDSHNVVFTVESDGYSTGTCFVKLTDQTQPDAVITDVHASSSALEVGQTVALSVTVANQGVALLPANTEVSIGCSGSAAKQSLYTPADLAAGDAVVLTTDYVLPVTAIGTYTLTATVNPDRKVTELNYNNNSLTSETLSLRPNFTATVAVDRERYVQGETVTISGQTTAGGCNADVEVYLVNNGTRQSLTLKADENGYFQTTYTPYDRQAGHFLVGACYPGTGERLGSTTFDVYGLVLSASYATHDISLGDEASGSFVIRNPGLLPQTGLLIEPQRESDGCELTIGQVSTIDADGQIEVGYKLKGTAVSQGRDWLQVPLTIKSSEGSAVTFTIYYYVRSLMGQLKVSQSRIETTMTKDVPRDYLLQVSNVGRGETGRISLSLPSWIESLTPLEMPSLSQGDTATIALRFKPTADMQVNVPVTGQIGINCEKGDGVAVGLHLTPVSEATGHLTIDVVDEYSFYAEGTPHVEGARVLVKHPTTGRVVAQGLTAADGRYQVELQEGWYTVSVNADRHQGYQTTLEVAPGKETGKQIFLTYEAISYSWEVVETEVEDRYEIETVVKYETNVPKPVVIITLPDEMPEIGSVVPVVVTNKGLISANNVDLNLSTSEGLRLEWLTDPTMAVLAPQQSAVFYAVLKESEAHQSRRAVAGDVLQTIVCLNLYAKLLAYYNCGDYERALAIESSRAWGKCLGNTSGGGGGGGGGSSWGGGGSGGGTYPHSSPGGSSNQEYAGVSYSGPVTPTKKECHEKDIEEQLTLPEIYDSKEPEHDGCNVNITGHVLVAAEGEPRVVEGVAADGASKVKIRLQGTIPLGLTDVDEPWPGFEPCMLSHYWTLKEEGIGSLQNADRWDGVTYVAPPDFPGGPHENTYTVTAVLHYDEDKTYEVRIEIKRAPVVLLHGLMGNYETWQKFWKRVTESGMYEPYQVLNHDYKSTNMSHFLENAETAGKRIEEVTLNYLHNGIVARKADLVGHSMGGILSRLHVQTAANGPETVHKVITVNTPHSGSRWGSLGLITQDMLNKALLRFTWLPNLFGADWMVDFKAVSDLATFSPATDGYLNRPGDLEKMYGIPVHAIVTDGALDPSQVVQTEENIINKILVFLVKIGFFGINKALEDHNDFVVSVKSQKGGLDDAYTSIIHNQMHVGSPDNSFVQDTLMSLLHESVSSQRFCLTGFRPDNMTLARRQHDSQPDVAKARRRAPALPPVVTASVSNNKLTASMSGAEGYDHQMMIAQFGRDAYCMVSGSELECEVPSSFSGEIAIYGIARMEGEDALWHNTTIAVEAPRTSRASISASDLTLYYGEPQSVSLTCTWSDGSITRVTPDDVTFTDNKAVYADGRITGVHGGSGTATFTYQGLTCTAPFTVYNFGNGTGGDNSKSVCSTITLKLSQTMTMTRQAFRGTLTVFNGNETTAMRNVKLSLQVTNTATGQIATSHEFQVNAESLDGFTGALDLNSGWTLGGNSTGKATVLFIPTKYAAPTEPVEWSFGGTLSYLDPFTGLEVTRDLYPVTLTVKPSPELDLTYFMQRDVLGDDPLTDEVEPIVPAEFALLINNKGYGDATNVRMVTQQPEIIENEKGLLIDFELVSSQVNGGDATLSFGETIANDFGTIPAHSQMYAQWWLTSTLLGHFVDYKVQATHVTSYGNEDLSLLDQVSIHELIHSLEVDDPAQGSGDKPLRGFMVNDIADADDLPDMLYLTNSEVLPVAIAASAQAQKTSATTYTVTITPSLAGWNYGNIVDPTCGMSAIKSIVRQSDGKQISLQNFWQTDRTLRDGKDPLYENRIHFADNFASTTAETYLLTFDPLPEVILAVESVGGVPDENTVAFSPVEQLTVRFNKPIDASTFTPDDLTFVAQGTRQDTGLIGITTADNQTFTLDLKAQTEPCPNGYYTLTVQTAGITDQEGFPGKTGKQVGWIMYRGGLVQLLTSAWPLNAGRVGIDLGLNSPARRTAATDGNTAQYGSTVTLMATPAPGYAFANWTLNGEVVSTNPEYEVLALGDMNVVANFTKMSYRVEVGSADAEQGTVAGATTGIYEHGTTLRLKAVPQGDYGFKCWMVDGVRMEETTDELTVSVDKAMTVEAVFRLAYSDQTIVLAQGWNWVSTYLQDALDATLLAPYADRIVGQDAELFRDPQLGMVGSLSTFQPGQAYKIQAANSASHTVHGQLFDEVPTLSLQKGWNWMAYPCSEQASLAVMRNAEAGDVIASQEGFACFDGTTWEGSVSEMHPGVGYLYKSASTKQLSFVVEPSPARRAVLRAPAARGLATLYPNTMNIVARIFRDGVELPGDDCLIYAMTGDELRGVSHFVGHNHYLTVYGDQPVTITFLIEHIATGETFKAVQSLPFHSDVVGSPLSPFAIQIGAATGIAVFGNDSPHAAAVFTLDGRKVCDATDKAALLHLPKGVYIVGGRKVVIN